MVVLSELWLQHTVCVVCSSVSTVFGTLTTTLHCVIYVYANSGCHIYVTSNMLLVRRSLILLLMEYSCGKKTEDVLRNPSR